MTSFREFVSAEDGVIESFVFIGRSLQSDQLSEAATDDMLQQPQSSSAVSFISNIVSKIRQAVSSVKDFFKKLATMSLEDAVAYCKTLLKRVNDEFNAAYSTLRTRSGENVVGESFGFLKRGVQFLVNKLIAPVLSLAWRTVTATANHILGSVWGAGRSGGITAFLGMFIAVGLTVALWPVFSMLSLAVTGTISPMWAIGGTGMGVWLVLSLMAWFKVNVLGRALSSVEDSPPPGSFKYGGI